MCVAVTSEEGRPGVTSERKSEVKKLWCSRDSAGRVSGLVVLGALIGVFVGQDVVGGMREVLGEEQLVVLDEICR